MSSKSKKPEKSKGPAVPIQAAPTRDELLAAFERARFLASYADAMAATAPPLPRMYLRKAANMCREAFAFGEFASAYLVEKGVSGDGE